MVLNKQLPRSVILACATMIVTTIASWIFSLSARLLGFSKPYDWPYYYKLIKGTNTTDVHLDLFGFFEVFRKFHTRDFFSWTPATPVPFTYPPANALVYRVFLPNLPHPVVAFTAFTLVIGSVAGILFARRLQQLGVRMVKAFLFVGCFFIFSSVLPFELNRLNTEIVVFALIAGYLWAFSGQKHDLAGALLGGAIALKLYPFILLGALVTAKQFRSAMLSLGVAASLTIAGLLAETPSLSLSYVGTKKGLQYFSDHYVTAYHTALGWDHSVFAFIKCILLQTPRHEELQNVYALYMVVIAIASLVLYFFRIRKLPVLNELCALVILLITIPPVSYEYTLLHLFSIFALFCCWCVRNRGRSEDAAVRAISVCFGILFAVIGFAIVQGEVQQGQVKCLVLVVLLAMLLLVPLKDELLDSVRVTT